MTREDFFRIQELSRTGLGIRAIARRLKLHRKSVRSALVCLKGKPSRKSASPRPSMLDEHSAWIQAKLERYPELSGSRIWRLLKDERNFTGGQTIVRGLVAELRPRLAKPKFTLAFAPGESAQVDWGSWKVVMVDGTSRMLHFFVMVLAYSRYSYVELSFSQAMEFWLGAHRRAFEYFGGVPEKVRVDRTKTAVLGDDPMGKPIITPAYAAFAEHYGFKVDPCSAYSPDQKGRVEGGVKYVKSAFCAGREPSSMPAMAAALREWLDGEANIRVHGTTGKRPNELFAAEERALLKPLPPLPYDCCAERQVVADCCFRISVDTNLYSVPAEYASRRLTLRLYSDRVLVRAPDGKLLADHPRSFARHRNFLLSEHERELILEKRHATDRRLLEHFLALGSATEEYLAGLRERRPDWRNHLRRINALSSVHDRDEMARVLEDALLHKAFGADYVQSLLTFRKRLSPEAGPLHVTRRADLLELDVPMADMNIYGKVK